jgi:hypothetical protein
LLLLGGCGQPREVPVARDSTPMPPRLADSLALRTTTGVEIWFTDSRTAEDSAGHHCVERVMEIRRDGRRIPVPLLYTGRAPEVVNDSTVRARIWLHCRPGNTYFVSLRTGFPTRVVP